MISQPFSEIGIQDAASHFRPGIIAGVMGLKLDAIKKIPKTRKYGLYEIVVIHAL